MADRHLTAYEVSVRWEALVDDWRVRSGPLFARWQDQMIRRTFDLLEDRLRVGGDAEDERRWLDDAGAAEEGP